MTRKSAPTVEQQALAIERDLRTVDRWIEALQILAGPDGGPSDEQQAEMKRIRNAMTDLLLHATAERIRLHVRKRWPQEYTSGETAADLIDPHLGKERNG